MPASRYKRGEEHPSWKGGRTMASGYVLIFMPNHHRADHRGYVREHIWVWEQARGQDIPVGWVVHHLNGVRNDNRPINLVAFPTQKHAWVLAAKAKRIQELEALLIQQGHLI